MADMELAAREDDYGDGVEQERGWEERLLTEGVMLELNTVAGDRRRRDDVMIDGVLGSVKQRKMTKTSRSLAIRAQGVAGRCCRSRGTCCGGRRRPGDAGYAGLELILAGHGDGDGRGVGSLPRHGRRQKRGKRSKEETLGLWQDFIGRREQLR